MGSWCRSRVLFVAWSSGPARRRARRGAEHGRRTIGGPPLLEVERVTKQFGGLTALDDVSFVVRQGEVTGLIGPNGAGKTTLFNVVSGFVPPTRGRVAFQGGTVTGLPPHAIARRGLARTFQIVRPFPGLSVHENLAVGA